MLSLDNLGLIIESLHPAKRSQKNDVRTQSIRFLKHFFQYRIHFNLAVNFYALTISVIFSSTLRKLNFVGSQYGCYFLLKEMRQFYASYSKFFMKRSRFQRYEYISASDSYRTISKTANKTHIRFSQKLMLEEYFLFKYENCISVFY